LSMSRGNGLEDLETGTRWTKINDAYAFLSTIIGQCTCDALHSMRI